MSVAKRREREREERRNWILDAAERAFAARGLDAVKMEDVADEAQLGKGTLYLYFRTKEGLIAAVAVRHQRRLLALFEREKARAATGIELVRALLLAFGQHMTDRGDHLRIAMSRWVSGTPFDIGADGAQVRENVQRIFTMVREAIELGQRDGTVAADIDPPRAAMALWSAVNGALLLRLQLCCLPVDASFREHAPALEAAIDFHLRALGCTREAPLAAAVGAPS